MVTYHTVIPFYFIDACSTALEMFGLRFTNFCGLRAFSLLLLGPPCRVVCGMLRMFINLKAAVDTYVTRTGPRAICRNEEVSRVTEMVPGDCDCQWPDDITLLKEEKASSTVYQGESGDYLN